MPMHQFRGVTNIFGGNRLHPGLEQVMIGASRHHHPKAQLGEHGEPQRIVFVHIQYPGNPDIPAECFLFGQAAIPENPLIFPIEQVRQRGLLGYFF